MQEYLVISALGSDKPGLVDKLSNAILDAECNIVDSRMTVLGGEFAIIVMVSGNWNCLAKLENMVPSLENKLDMTIITKRTQERKPSKTFVPYIVEAIAVDHPGIVYNLANFFSTRNINIDDLLTESYSAAHTGTPMFAVTIEVSIPSNTHISDLRDEFLEFCDEFNLDASLEPNKS